MNIRVNTIKKSLFNRVYKTNKKNFLYKKYYQIIITSEDTLYDINLNRYYIVDSALFKNNFL